MSLSLYCNKSDAARFFGISRTKLYGLLEGIEKEIQAGRYGQYSVADGLVNKAVLLDYMRYRKALNDRHARPYVPPYNEEAAARAVVTWMIDMKD